MKPSRLRIAIRRATRATKVVVAGLQEFQAHQGNTQISGEEIEASRRALERSEAIVHAELKRGVSALATIGSTAPFVGSVPETVVGIINAFKTMAAQKTPGIGAIAGGISEALVTTAIGLFVAVPAVWMYNYFTGRVDAFDVEMGNSSSELVDYFVKRAEAKVRRPQVSRQQFSRTSELIGPPCDGDDGNAVARVKLNAFGPRQASGSRIRH